MQFFFVIVDIIKYLQTEQNCQKHNKPLAISEDKHYGQSHGH